MSCQCNDLPKFTIRSTTPLTSTSEDIANFIKSKDYINYQANFESSPQFDKSRLITFNNTTKQGIFVPIQRSNTEASAIISYFDIGRTNYTTIVLSSTGDLKNMLNLSGTLHIYTTLKDVILRGDFTDGLLTTLDQPPTTAPQGVSVGFGDCVVQSTQQITENAASVILCAFVPEDCAIGVLLHCAQQTYFPSL